MALPRFQPRRFEPRLLIGRGSRATEAFLLAEIDRRLAEAERKPALLAKPVRVVVPSRSLRLHLGAAITRHRGRSAAGLLLQTHFHLALEVIERAGETLQAGRWLAELLPERGARERDDLARPLAGLSDGFAAVLPTVRDLLDARFEPALFEGLDEALEQDGPKVATRRQVARARALLEVAQETAAEIETTGLGWPASVLTRAADLLEARGEALLPARMVLLHGYSDATGVVTDLAQALQRRFGAWVLLDRPPDPARRGGGRRSSAGPGPEGRFGQELVQRLQQTATPEPIPDPSADPTGTPPGTSWLPEIDLFTAQGAAGEVREVVRRIAVLLAADARPEGIAVVARDLAPYRREVRRRFSLLGLPYSALGEVGAPTPAERRSRALLDLLRCGGRTPTERWIEAMERLPASSGRALAGVALMDLRLGLATLGAGRLQDAAALDLDALLGERTVLPLPVRQGIRSEPTSDRDGGPEDTEDDEGSEEREDSGASEAARVRILRRTLGRSVLEAAVTAARRLLSVLEHWPRRATPGEHRKRLERLVAGELGQGGEGPLLAALAALDREAPAGFTLSFDELRRLLARMLDARPAGEENALGGRGGGIQVLSVTEARGRTFDHLFVLGCNRGVFPRPIREDPLLPDALRKLLRPLLPDIPIKEIGFDEERYLFAQLLSASPRVTISWQEIDDTGAVRPPSPLVERLGLVRHGELAAPVQAEPAWTVSGKTATGPLPPAEAATLVALHGSRSAFREVFPLAVPGTDTDAEASAAEIAGARLAVLDEQDPDLSTPEGRATAARLGPFFGFVGATEASRRQPDPRRRDLWVTTMERLTGCPWQVFLTRLLGLEPTPDPLAALPGIDPLLLGKTVHRTLEAVVTLPGGPALRDRTETLDAIRDRSPVRPPWPEDAELDELLTEAARTTLLEAGQALPGLTRALARAARPHLQSVRETDWRSAPPEVLGIEVRGSLAVARRLLRFRADRVDRHPDGGGLVLTDYKTGRPPRNNGAEGKKPETRRSYLLRDVVTGTRLQAVAYALAGSSPESAAAIGRYLFLRPDTEHREREVGPEDPDFAKDFVPAFRRAVEAGLGVWDAGAFFPRVVDPQGEQEPPRCSWCPVAEACVRGDSGARLRLAEHGRRAGPHATDPAQAAQLALWWLGEEKP